MPADVSDSKALQVAKWIVDKGINGVPPLSGSAELAEEYLLDDGYASNAARVKALIRWESSKNFASGFLTGLGGIITLPVAVPAALGASWVVQSRMIGAIACIYGYDLSSDRVRTLVLLCLVGDGAKEILKEAGVRLTQRVSMALIERIPGRVLTQINRAVGRRIITKAGEKGILNLTKIIPGLSGGVAGVVDGYTCKKVGDIAQSVFRKKPTRKRGTSSRGRTRR